MSAQYQALLQYPQCWTHTWYQELVYYQKCQTHTAALSLWMGMPWTFLGCPHSSQLLWEVHLSNLTRIVRLPGFLAPPAVRPKELQKIILVFCDMAMVGTGRHSMGRVSPLQMQELLCSWATLDPFF